MSAPQVNSGTSPQQNVRVMTVATTKRKIAYSSQCPGFGIGSTFLLIGELAMYLYFIAGRPRRYPLVCGVLIYSFADDER